MHEAFIFQRKREERMKRREERLKKFYETHQQSMKRNLLHQQQRKRELRGGGVNGRRINTHKVVLIW